MALNYVKSNLENEMIKTAIFVILLSASVAYAGSPFDGVWGANGKAVLEIRDGTVKSVAEPSMNASVCIAQYNSAQQTCEALEASFEYVCGDGSSGGIGITTFVLDGDSLTELTCDGMNGASKEQMRCFDPAVLIRMKQ